MKKNILLIIVLVGINFSFDAQNTIYQVIATSGESFKNSNFQLDWTLGELQTETYDGLDITLTQGFQQADYKKTVTEIEKSELYPTNITVFPNPTSDFIYININNLPIINLEYIITDILGKYLIINNITNNNTKISFNTFKKGTYFIGIKQNSKILQTLKIIIL